MASPDFPHVPLGREPGKQTLRTARQYISADQLGGLAGVVGRFFRDEGPGRAENVRIDVDRRELRRGEEVVARIEVLDGRQLPQGTMLTLLCECRHNVTTGSADHRSLSEYRDILHRQDVPLSPTPAVQEVRFRVPEDSAYSWEGTVISFNWRVVIIEPTGGKEPDVLMTPFWVTP